MYEKRAKLVEGIPNFWPLVLEQAPQEIDQYIQPTDSNALVHLRSIDVKRFEIAPYAGSGSSGGDGDGDGDAASGNPRSVAITFTFGPNEWFADEVLEKKFWFRRRAPRAAPDGSMDQGWSGLVSEPVRIRWKGRGKDLTEGLNAAAYAAWQAEQRHAETIKAQDGTGDSPAGRSEGKRVWLPEHEVLKKLLGQSTEGASSFFTWFSYRGPNITAEESRLATLEQEAQRRKNGQAKDKGKGRQENGGEDSDASPGNVPGDADELNTEVFPSGEDLAIAISDDLFPGAVNYFRMSGRIAFPHSLYLLRLSIYLFLLSPCHLLWIDCMTNERILIFANSPSPGRRP